MTLPLPNLIVSLPLVCCLSLWVLSLCHPLVNLVNKDQLDILASLRESVNEDKADLELELAELQKHIRDLKDRNRMQLEQINNLLLEKVDMQSESIGHREKMLEREKAFG